MNALALLAYPQLNEVPETGPVPARAFGVIYDPNITSLRGHGSSSLESVTTVTVEPLSLIMIVISGSESTWRLVSGMADPSDPDGEVAPLDYNVVTNNVHWEKVAGL